MKKKHLDPHAGREAQKYESPIASREYLMALLQDAGNPLSFEQFSKALNFRDEQDNEALRRRLRAMVRDGQLQVVDRTRYALVDEAACIRGCVLAHKEGFGFVVSAAGGGDIYLSPREMQRVFHNDEVIVRVTGLDKRGRSEGTIVSVVSHNTQQLAGRLCMEDDLYHLQADDARVTQRVSIERDDLNGAVLGDIIVVEILTQPTPSHYASGCVKEVLGAHMAPGMEVMLALRSHGLPHVFSDEALAEAAALPAHVYEKECEGRVDLRALPFVTIDGEDAKDFDDAVYCEIQPKGHYRLFVAIADVAHYVQLNSHLDRDARERGNSVYFPGEVIPMLPESLSNGLCSLNPNVDRLVLVCDMLIAADGQVIKYDFYESVIHSHARMTYTLVHEILEGNAGACANYTELLPQFHSLYACYKVLLAAREARGAIEFSSTETKIIFGEGRKIEKIVPVERNDAHRLIEECMLCANVCTANYLIKHKVPALYRVHHGPTPEKLVDLRRSLNEWLLTLQGGDKVKPSDYAKLLASLAGRPEAHFVNMLLLRSLSQAVYTPEQEGHFGLAYAHYTHFTSPIRRYPDLVIHRLLKAISTKRPIPSHGNLQEIGEHCSMTERRGDEASWNVIAWLKCEYMQDRVGETFDGIIAGVTGFGFFVELKEIYVEGLVHITTLNDYFVFDAARHQLVGEKSGERYQLRQTVRVVVARVSLDDRKIDFVVEKTMNEKPVAPKKKTKRRPKKKKT